MRKPPTSMNYRFFPLFVSWETGTRMWEASKALMAIKRRSEKDSDITWDTAELLIPCA
jgi:hypothetical protein